MRKFTNVKRHYNGTTLLSQRGVVIPIVVIGLLALLAVAGLALDGSHALANKTRMQNTADASALAAAKELNETDGDTGLATVAANSLFSINADGVGNHELNAAYDAGDITVTVQYSATLNPFVPGSFVPGTTSWFVRVIATGFDTQTTLSRVLGFNQIATPATAVAGPSGPLGSGGGGVICDVAPIAVCANDALDGDQGKLRVLKPEPGVHADIGPGNYKMLRLDDGCGVGGSCLRQHMAGSYAECLTDLEDVDTEPGVSSGPVSQGFNTRFNQYQGAGLNPHDYPPDKYVSEQDIDVPEKILRSCNDPLDQTIEHIFLTDPPANNYCQGFDPYAPDYATSDWFAETVPDQDASHVPYNYERYSGADPGPYTTNCDGCTPLTNRRVLVLPRINCEAAAQSGQTTLPTDGFACFFMLQSLEGGQAQGAGNIFGQFIDDCEANGSAGTNPGGGPADPLLYKIQLYKDPDSGDS